MSPGNGSFLVEDEILGRLQNPVTLHRYQYTGGSPVNRVDPTGREFSADGLVTAMGVSAVLCGVQGFVMTYIATDGDAQAAWEDAKWEALKGAAYGAVGYFVGMALGAKLVTSRVLKALETEDRLILNWVWTVLKSPQLNTFRTAMQQGVSAEMTIGGRTIIFVPELNAYGLGIGLGAGEEGMLIGRTAVGSLEALTKTLIHEAYRLATTNAARGVSAELAASETTAAWTASERLYAVGRMAGIFPLW